MFYWDINLRIYKVASIFKFQGLAEQETISPNLHEYPDSISHAQDQLINITMHRKERGKNKHHAHKNGLQTPVTEVVKSVKLWCLIH